MPDLQNSYIYKDWILDVSRVEKEEWSKFNLYHQCHHGFICRAKGVLKNPDIDDFSHFVIACSKCNVEIADATLQQMRAMWNLLSKS